jgi:hypothetical protein
MACLLVTYDLNRPGQDYHGLWAYLRQYQARRILLSVWVLKTEKTAANLLAEMTEHLLDNNDKVFVCSLAGSWVARMLDEDSAWITRECR